MFSKYTHVHVIYHVPCYIYHIICRMKIDRILNILCYMLLITYDMVPISCYKYPIKVYITCYDKFLILCDSHKIFLFVKNISHTADLTLLTHTHLQACTHTNTCMRVCAHTADLDLSLFWLARGDALACAGCIIAKYHKDAEMGLGL